VNLAKELIETKTIDLENKNEIAEKIGVGAIIFNDISGRRNQNINFKWEDVLNFDGETGPYVQYTYARIFSLLNKANFVFDKDLLNNINYKLNDLEFEILKTVSMFKEKILLAKNEAEPFLLARYVLDLCQLFNKFYYMDKIITNLDLNQKNSKLLIIFLDQKVLDICFDIMNIPKLKRM
jgi:arginyl-tRNA synthetase